MNCKNCGNPLKNHNVYCDNHCQKEYQYKKYIEQWQKGIVSGLKGKYQISNHIRHYLLVKYNYSCAQCGWKEKNPFTGVCPLEN